MSDERPTITAIKRLVAQGLTHAGTQDFVKRGLIGISVTAPVFETICAEHGIAAEEIVIQTARGRVRVTQGEDSK